MLTNSSNRVQGASIPTKYNYTGGHKDKRSSFYQKELDLDLNPFEKERIWI